MSDRYAVIGNPIAHSKSPQIHGAFARQTGQDLTYGRLLGHADRFAEEVRRFFAEGGRGLNVTVPFKESAWGLADLRTPRAETAGAVNTLIPLSDGRLRGDNTDGVGLVRDLALNHGFAFRGKRVLLLGAGGASRGVLRPLLETRLAQLVIANRTPSKALDLAGSAAALGPVRGCGLADLGDIVNDGFDLIVNGTSAGLAGEVPSLSEGCLVIGGWTYDMLYGDRPTPFCQWGASRGAARALDGLGMLVEQAAESFWMWRGVRPETRPVIEMLRHPDRDHTA
jgi:shikimate dehydrogenase